MRAPLIFFFIFFLIQTTVDKSQDVSGLVASVLPPMLDYILSDYASNHPDTRDPEVSIRQHTSAYVSIRQHTSAYVSIRQHTSAYVRIRYFRIYPQGGQGTQI